MENRAAPFLRKSERARELFARLIDAHADDIAIIPSVSYGIGLASALVEVNAGDEILILQDQFPSNVYPWRELARAKDAKLTTVARPVDFGTECVRQHSRQRHAYRPAFA